MEKIEIEYENYKSNCLIDIEGKMSLKNKWNKKKKKNTMKVNITKLKNDRCFGKIPIFVLDR